MRRFTCEVCGRVGEAPGRRGRLPRYCVECRPGGHSQGERIRQLEAEVALLRAQVAADARGRLAGEPSREAVQVAVRRVAWAEGRAATREALLNLAAEARAWAVRLANSDEEAARR